MTDLAAFKASLAEASPPPGLTVPLRALWHAARGEWDAVERQPECRSPLSWTCQLGGDDVARDVWGDRRVHHPVPHEHG